MNANGSFTYTPATNYSGPDSFTYRASDGALTSGLATVAITVTSSADAPVATNDSYTTAEDTPLTIAAPGVLGNDSDPDGTAPTAVLGVGPAHGTLTLNANGSFTYTPATNYSGPDSFTYRASDGALTSGLATVAITVTPSADAPIAAGDSYTTAEDTPLTIAAPGVLGNDSDPDGTAPTAVLGVGPAHGMLTLNANGSFTYTPATNYSGPDSFTYRASDGALTSALATVAFTVTPSDDAPIAAGDSYTTAEDTPLTIAAAPGVLGNDTDADGSALTAVLVAGPAQGTLALNPNGSFTYTPAATTSGADSFTYRANDGTMDSNVATVAITVTAVNDAPTFTTGGNHAVNEDAAAQSVAWATAMSPGPANEAGQALDFIVSNDNNALFSAQPAVAANGTLSYTPMANVNGSATVTVRLHDNGGVAGGGADTGIAQTFTITVAPLNDAPGFIKGGNQTVSEDAAAQSAAAWATAINAGPANETGQALDFIVSNDNSALFSAQPAVAANGTLSYTPMANANGSATVTVRLHDNGGVAGGGADTSAPQTFTITVTSVNDLPTISNVADQTTPGAAVGPLNVTIGDVETAATALTLTAASTNTALVPVANVAFGGSGANRTVTVTPVAGQSGSTVMTLTVGDGTGSAFDTFTVTVTAGARPPPRPCRQPA